MSQSLEIRAAVKTSGDTLKRYVDFEQMQISFISYKNKVNLFFYFTLSSRIDFVIFRWSWQLNPYRTSLRRFTR